MISNSRNDPFKISWNGSVSPITSTYHGFLKQFLYNQEYLLDPNVQYALKSYRFDGKDMSTTPAGYSPLQSYLQPVVKQP